MREQEQTAVRARDYLSLLWMVVAAVLGMSLLCGVAAVGISDINNAALIGTPTAGLVDFVISNVNTMIVETVQVFSQPELSKTPIPSPSLTNTATTIPTGTHVIFNPFPTSTPPRGGQFGQPTFTYTPRPTATHTQIPPSSTPRPTATHTDTPIPPDTDTPVPTATPIPNTDTPVPTFTPIPDTPVPTDTDTPIPDTPVPTDTDIP